MNEITKHYKFILFFFIVAAMILMVLNFTLVEKLELIAFDLRTEFRKKPASSDIVIVRIDDNVINKLAPETGRWPWGRGVIGKVIKRISENKPRAIIMDLKIEGRNPNFDNKKYSDKDFINYIKGIKNVFYVKAAEIGKSADMKQSTTSQKSIDKNSKDTGKYVTIAQNANKESIALLNFSKYNKFFNNNSKDKDLIDKKIRCYSITKALEELYNEGKGISIINVGINPLDNTVRTLQPVYKYYDLYLLANAMAVVHFLNGSKDIIELHKDFLKLGDKKIPLNNKYQFYLNWRDLTKPDPKRKHDAVWTKLSNAAIPYKTVSFDVLFNDANYNLYKNPYYKELLKDRIVIIGIYSTHYAGQSDKDVFKVPNQNYFAGPSIIATAIDNLLNDQGFISRVPVFINILISMFLITLIFLFFRLFPMRSSYYAPIINSLTLIILYVGINIFLFSYASIWLDIVNPILVSAFTLVFSISLSLIIEKDKRSVIESTFSKYVSPQVFKTLLKNYKDINLGAERREITMLFCDIRGFTPFSEDLLPEEVSRYLNEYFTEMVEVILKHNGTIDKFMGDAIMAFFGAPIRYEDHAYQAAQAALGMVEELNKLNIKWSQQGRRLLNIGIGLNTGKVLVGNFGSPKLMDYTVLGDAVNLASRLESLNKEENTNILISAFTYQSLMDLVDVRIVGPRRVKGKAETVVVYELLGLKDKSTN